MDDKTLRNKQGLTEEEFLAQYDAGKFERPSVTVDMLIFTVMGELRNKALKILMVRRGDHPFLGYWALPGGFVNMDESLDEAALRELKEETNIDDIYMEQLYTWGDVGRDPRTRIIGCSYMALADSGRLEVKAGDDAEEAAWFTVTCNVVERKRRNKDKGFIVEDQIKLTLWNESNELSATIKVESIFDGGTVRISRKLTESKGIAFDHGKIIEYAVERLRYKILYNDIAFGLVPECFTLTELQEVYEAILGRELPEADFRKMVSDMVVEAYENTGGAGSRTSRLFRYSTDRIENRRCMLDERI